MAHRAMRLKPVVREVSERRQVGDAEEMMAKGAGRGGGEGGGRGIDGQQEQQQQQPWWRNVGMDEGL